MSDPIETNLPFGRNYAQQMLVLECGDGVYLRDRSGKAYLDFGAGIAVNALGYGRKDLAGIASRQISRLMHVSNLFATEPALRLGETLRDLASRRLRRRYQAVYFGNSGTEANEAALKFARLRSLRTKGPGHHRFLCFENGFHGRTYGALSVTPNPKYQSPFVPLLEDVTVLEFNNTEALGRTLDETYAAVIVEVVQGEGGLGVMSREFADALSAICKDRGVTLILDEIQTGLGRTGPFFAAEHHNLSPDIITLSKPLAAGLPLSATIMTEEINWHLEAGHHGSTFGGGPVACAVANEVVSILTAPDFCENLTERVEVFDQELWMLSEAHPRITGVRGLGMLRGLEIAPSETQDAGSVIAAAQMNGLIVLRSGTNVVRLAPPLIISPEEIRRGIAILSQTVEEALTETSLTEKGRNL
jgi:acetylornithine/N-succinyldiaminopimelate aminotransferase